GNINNLQFKTGEENLKWKLTKDHKDICIVTLSKPLKPGESIEITTPFNVKVPSGTISRLGHLGQSYQITQWFPKPAVYDLDGWHTMPYLDQGEFYSEYGTFDVHITLPENYVVGATGDLINGENELNWLNEKASQTQKLVDNGDLDYAYNIKGGMDFPPSSDESKTLHYHQENVHDFAWFADKRYHVLKGEVELPQSKKTVTTWAMFTNNEADIWQKSIEYLNDATYYYSLWNGDYPYNHVTAVDGSISAGGGMEYPNVTVIGESYDAFTLETTIMHEVGHNWFYGIFGTNERVHGWMDEGLNTMNENRYIEKKYPNKTLLGNSDSSQRKILMLIDIAQYKHKASYELSYLVNARRNKDQAISTHSAELTSSNYGGITYSKTGIVFDYLMAYLGEETYDKCMHQYFEKWKFKHPQPKDLRAIFESETGKDLSWFFDGIINTTDKIDYKIIGSQKNLSKPDSVTLKVSNKGKINGPFSISGIKDDKILTTQWYEPIGKTKSISFLKGDYDKYKIDAQLDIPEINRKNNTLKTKGIFKKMEPLRFQYGGSLENPDKTQLFFTPIAGWNMNDKGMLGLAFYNSVIPQKRFEYVIAPLYAINSENLNGYASAFYNIHPNSIFQNIRVGSNAASFSYLRFNTDQNSTGREILEYYKVAPSAKFTFKKKRERQQTTFFLSLKNISIFEEKANFNNQIYNVELENYYVNQIILSANNTNLLNPYSANLELQQSDNFIKLNLTANYHIAYKKKKTGFDIRVFAGRFLSNNNADSKFNYGLSGNSDYLYDNILLARNTFRSNSGYLSQQFALNDGGFKHLTLASSSNSWISSINLKTNLFTSALSFYADIGWVGLQPNSFTDKTVDTAFETGVALNIVPKVFEIYFPIKLSSDLNQLTYAEKIRFTINLNTLNPFKMFEQFGF
ncbi:M1 family metallopeptidase, partial [Vicingaceae bacterium]|nr:M1 family metallopeptidase [Vicingaceae bacterium]